MNAHLGRDKNQHKSSFHESTNRNGEHIHTFLLENKLICLNARYQKRLGKRWTHTHPNGSKAQLDFFFINKKWINSCGNCEAYNSFCGVSSDHRIASCNLRLSLRKNKTKKTSLRLVTPSQKPRYQRRIHYRTLQSFQCAPRI